MQDSLFILNDITMDVFYVSFLSVLQPLAKKAGLPKPRKITMKAERIRGYNPRELDKEIHKVKRRTASSLLMSL